MSKYRRVVTPEELASVVKELVDQLSVLVRAVDDLRCEVESWRRNGGEIPLYGTARPLQAAQVPTTWTVHPPQHAEESGPSGTLPPPASASERLWAFESLLMSGQTHVWAEPWTGDDAPGFPVGCVLALDEDLWQSVLHLRPAHLVAVEDDSCEADCGAPYLIAWRESGVCYLRELNAAEALQLQRLCLAAREAELPPEDCSRVSAQRLLW